MKRLLTLLFSITSLYTYAGNESDKIALAIQNSNTTELSNMFNTSIELVTPNSSGVTNRDQARIVLENFFKNNVPVKASVAHETNGTTNSMVVISLVTKNGSFRISIVGTNKGGVFVINEFKIT